jgi:hypothetical protein
LDMSKNCDPSKPEISQQVLDYGARIDLGKAVRLSLFVARTTVASHVAKVMWYQIDKSLYKTQQTFLCQFHGSPCSRASILLDIRRSLGL